jgi:hypothetical protein
MGTVVPIYCEGCVSETERFSDAEIDFVRRFAPRKQGRRKLMYELGMINAMKLARASGK